MFDLTKRLIAHIDPSNQTSHDAFMKRDENTFIAVRKADCKSVAELPAKLKSKINTEKYLIVSTYDWLTFVNANVEDFYIK